MGLEHVLGDTLQPAAAGQRGSSLFPVPRALGGGGSCCSPSSLGHEAGDPRPPPHLPRGTRSRPSPRLTLPRGVRGPQPGVLPRSPRSPLRLGVSHELTQVTPSSHTLKLRQRQEGFGLPWPYVPPALREAATGRAGRVSAETAGEARARGAGPGRGTAEEGDPGAWGLTSPFALTPSVTGPGDLCPKPEPSWKKSRFGITHRNRGAELRGGVSSSRASRKPQTSQVLFYLSDTEFPQLTAA